MLAIVLLFSFASAVKDDLTLWSMNSGESHWPIVGFGFDSGGRYTLSLELTHVAAFETPFHFFQQNTTGALASSVWLVACNDDR